MGILVQCLVNNKPVNRRQCLFGDRVLDDELKMISYPGILWPKWMESLRNSVSKFLQAPFECALITEFPSGSASLAAQYETENVVEKSTMACICIGANCTFEVFDGKTNWKPNVNPGSLYTLEGDFQHLLRHGIRQQMSIPNSRYLICFRHARPVEPEAHPKQTEDGERSRRPKRKTSTIKKAQSMLKRKAGLGSASGSGLPK
jgi:hypothetical protein